MQIYIDADACPKAIKEVLFKLATRTGVNLILVANQYIPYPKLPNIRLIQVAKGFDVADDTIVEQISAGDLVITSDIPLANYVIEKKAHALNPKGHLYTKDNIKSRLATRDLMEHLRENLVVNSTTASFSKQDVQNFANQIDKIVTKYLNQSSR